uniref:Uncharacterized protein n=1 Tax=Kalanchoe fedtschenkoi TaxID=63787 RepID=A0A7N0ZZP7_KALFE
MNIPIKHSTQKPNHITNSTTTYRTTKKLKRGSRDALHSTTTLHIRHLQIPPILLIYPNARSRPSPPGSESARPRGFVAGRTRARRAAGRISRCRSSRCGDQGSYDHIRYVSEAHLCENSCLDSSIIWVFEFHVKGLIFSIFQAWTQLICMPEMPRFRFKAGCFISSGSGKWSSL